MSIRRTSSPVLINDLPIISMMEGVKALVRESVLRLRLPRMPCLLKPMHASNAPVAPGMARLFALGA